MPKIKYSYIIKTLKKSLEPMRSSYRIILVLAMIISFTACHKTNNISFNVTDTDFSKGRIGYHQTISINDLEKFHGHLCDGLVEGALALKLGLKAIYPNDTIDRTDLQIVSKPSPCLTDAAIYITGGRYQYNSFYVDTDFDGLYIIKQKQNNTAYSIKRKEGVKPKIIDELGDLAIQQKLSPCGIDSLRKMENAYMKKLLDSNVNQLFIAEQLPNFAWQPKTKYNYVKTDIINKHLRKCN